jgi:hypothetical protein
MIHTEVEFYGPEQGLRRVGSIVAAVATAESSIFLMANG